MVRIGRTALVALAGATLLLGSGPTSRAKAGSLYFGANRPEQYDFADLSVIPAPFGRAEFTFEIWVRPDHRFPVGETFRGSKDQLVAWSIIDPKPYSSNSWWFAGNWLIDGHSRPDGFDDGNSRAGTFSLQFYGAGRLRWMFADSATNMPKGMVYVVQATPAGSTPSLLDGKWHHVAAVRRWRPPSGATLELWVDGRLTGRTEIPLRVDMRRFWDKPPHPNNPRNVGGWSFGSEVMTAWDYFFTQYEDYKGWVDDMRFWSRALSSEEIARAALAQPVSTRKLVSHFQFEEGKGAATCDTLSASTCMTLHRTTPSTWSNENAPVASEELSKTE